MAEEICSVARLLNRKDCYSGKRTVKRCFKETRNIADFSPEETDLLLFRSGLEIENVSDVCPYHQHFFCIDTESYFYEVKKDQCCNPLGAHEASHKGVHLVTIEKVFKNYIFQRSMFFKYS